MKSINLNLSYNWLYDTALNRFKSEDELEDFLPKPLPQSELSKLSNDRYLSAMTQRVFQAGMQHSVVDNKWPDFEQAFNGFNLQEVLKLNDADFSLHMQNKKLIRHLTKLQTIPKNAKFILNVEQTTGKPFGEFIANWPVSDIIGLWSILAKQGSRLGGRSSSGFLRLAGKDTFFITSDVIARLIAAGVITKTPTSQRDLKLVQNSFNALHEESGRPLCQLSSMLALSINPRF